LLCQDLHESVIIGSIGVVVYLGKCLDFGVKEGTNNFVEGIKEVLSKTPVDSTIILETGAGQGSEICTSLFDLGRLYQMFTDDERKRVKFCIDTCHVFSAGYDIGHYGFVDVFDSLVETNLGWKNVVCVHLNNSKCILGSKKDRHADLTKGHIDEDGLAKFVRICNSKEIPIIMETPCEEMSKSDQLKLLKTWLTQK
jgi:deoxyribonuclease-4